MLQVLRVWRKSPNNHILSYNGALQRRTQCESIEAAVRTRRLLCLGALLCRGNHRLHKRVMSGEVESGTTWAGEEGEIMDGLRGRGSSGVKHHGGLNHRHICLLFGTAQQYAEGAGDLWPRE